MGSHDERQTAVAANGETTADGDVQIAKMGNQHLFNTTKLKVKLDGAERAEDNALYALKTILQL